MVLFTRIVNVFVYMAVYDNKIRFIVCKVVEMSRFDGKDNNVDILWFSLSLICFQTCWLKNNGKICTSSISFGVKGSSRILFIILYLQFIDTLGSKYMLMMQDTILE